MIGNTCDELAKALAQSATRRQALKKFGVGLASLALACFGLASKAKAAPRTCLPSFAACNNHAQCCSNFCSKNRLYKRSGYCT
jgi:hypothetical protein